MLHKFILSLTVGTVVLLTCLGIAYFRDSGLYKHLAIGLLLGSTYGHHVLLSGWMVFGPGGRLRVPLALVWLAAIPGTCMLCDWSKGARILAFEILTGICVVVLVQLVAWPLRFWWGLHIGNPELDRSRSSVFHSHRRFGINQIMLVTTLVAIFIGIGRWIFPHMIREIGTGEFSIFVVLVFASCTLSFPLFLAIVGARKPLLPTVLLLAFTVLATYYELHLFSRLGAVGGPDRLHLALINSFTLLPICIVGVALRLTGYRFLVPSSFGHTDSKLL